VVGPSVKNHKNFDRVPGVWSTKGDLKVKKNCDVTGDRLFRGGGGEGKRGLDDGLGDHVPHEKVG